MKIVEQLNNKKIVIWGYGREGKSSEAFIRTHVKTKSLEIFEGNYEDIKNIECDVILKSPGIKLFEEDDRIKSQTSLFISEFREQIIGITGTKGKSTTSSMLYSVLTACGKETVLVGNIGFPCLDFYDSIQENTYIVFELSCHQLQKQKESPHIAVFLNLFEDHLDYYGTKKRYFDAKQNIVLHQTESDFALLGSNVPIIQSKSKKIVFDEKKQEFLTPMKLKGTHNIFNATIVDYIARALIGCKEDQVKDAISSFEGLKHRLENIGIYSGVTYYDDSISTICESTIHAVETVEQVDTVIIGGMDRGISYKKIEEFIENNQELHFILMYASGKRIYDELEKKDNCVYCETLEDSVRTAKKITKKGGACVLSPAAASYDNFKNFEDRGEQFAKLVFQI